ncbi:MAG: glutaredoxin family protein [Gemmataceae bacterium]|nr:glutaredoxin family protein [Gemmataceae bacterium]
MIRRLATLLASLLRPRWFRPRLAHLDFVLYTRQGCHLCESAWQCLRTAQQRYHFTLAAVDVDTEPELGARYGMEVPVVVVNGKVRFRGGLNRVLLDRFLRGEARRTQGERRAGS